MPMPEVRPIPSEFGSIVVQLVVNNARTAIDFYRRAFGADELFRNEWPDDPRIFHCELLIGGGRLLLQDEFPEHRLLSPKSLGGSPATVHIYVEDAAKTLEDAAVAGAQVISPVSRRFWGIVSGAVEDPFGHRWVVATRVEDLDPQEIASRAAGASRGERLPFERR